MISLKNEVRRKSFAHNGASDFFARQGRWMSISDSASKERRDNHYSKYRHFRGRIDVNWILFMNYDIVEIKVWQVGRA